MFKKTEIGKCLYEESFEDESDKTKVLMCARTQVEGGKVEWEEAGLGYYKFSATQHEVKKDLQDWWSKIDANHDEGLAVTLQDKHLGKERNYPTNDQIQEISKRLFGSRK